LADTTIIFVDFPTRNAGRVLEVTIKKLVKAGTGNTFLANFRNIFQWYFGFMWRTRLILNRWKNPYTRLYTTVFTLLVRFPSVPFVALNQSTEMTLVLSKDGM
jgi:hypothetical protein